MRNAFKNWTNLILLILAGEAVFVLPFVLQRVFRATVLDVFAINNTELGLCFTAYGLVAMVSYLFGGPLADRYEPRKLIAISLWTTALGGLVYALYPGFFVLQILYGYWGFTSIFLFWSPMIKATRILGGSQNQAKAFGFLDGGRGLVAVLVSVFAIGVFASELNAPSSVDLENQKQAFKLAIYLSSILVTLVGLGVWIFLKKDTAAAESKLKRISVTEVLQVLRLQSVWLLMLVVLCAYVAYKTTDVISLYAKEVLKYDEVKAAQAATFMLFIRPIAGFLIGVYADRLKSVRLLLTSFLVIVGGSIWFAMGWGHGLWILFLVSVFLLGMGVFAARALYFAVQQEGAIPLHLSGTAVGLISVIGFTPDVFAGVMVGAILDQNPGQLGHQYVFLVLAVFGTIGAYCSWRYLNLEHLGNSGDAIK